jgi:GT2 family glycosyltransferase
MGSCQVSIIVISHNEGEYLGRTIESFLAALPPQAEILVVDDWSTDGSASALQNDRVVRILRPARRLGAVKARNYGARYARGEILLFSDAHVEVPKNWFGPLLAPLTRPAVGAVGPAISMMYHPDSTGFTLRFTDSALNSEWGRREGQYPYAVPLLGAGFCGMRREVFDAFGGFDTGMIMYGMEDPELDIRLWSFGYECVLVPDVEIAHLFREEHNFTDWERLLHNILRYGTIHYNEERMQRLIASYAEDSTLPAALARVAASDAWERRNQIQSTRYYDDDWYFGTFGMNC